MKNLLSEKNRKMTFILVTMFLNFLGFSIIIPILPFLIEEFVDPSRLAFYVTVIFSVYALCQFLSAPGLGALSDLWGRRPVLLLSLFGSIVGYLFLAFGGSIALIFVGRIIDGLTGGNISTVYAYLADITEPSQRSKYYGMVGAAGGFGFMVGPAIGGILGAAHLAAPLILAAGITAVNMIWGFFVLPESLKSEHKLEKFEISHLNPFGHLFELFRIDILKKLFISSFVFFVGLFSVYGITSVYAKEVFNWNTTKIGILLFAVGVVDIISQGFLVRKLTSKLGEIKLSVWGIILAGIGVLLAAETSIAVSVFVFYAGFILLNLGDGLMEPSFSGLVANSVGPKMQGRVQGGYQSVQAVARIIGPLFAGWAYVIWKGLPYASGALLCLVGVIVFVTAIPAIKNHKVELG